MALSLLLLGLLACSRYDVVPADLGQPAVVDDPAGGLCVSALLDRDTDDAANAHRDAQVAALADVGVRVVRQDLRWADVERTKGTFDWTRQDLLQDGVEAAGAERIAMLGYGNPWATSVDGADEFYPPDDPQDFADFAAEAARHYQGRIHRWEIWNEPNSGFRFWKQDPPAISGQPERYADLFVAAAQAIHAVDPDAEVEVGSVFFHEQGIIGGVEFLQDAIAARPEILDEADAVSFHPYTLYPPRVGPEDADDGEEPLWDMIADLRDVTGHKPLVITEVGWPSFGDVDEQTQADWLVREIALAQSEGVKDVCWYTLEDKEDPSNPEEAFGLYRYGATERKPSGDAFAELADVLAQVDVANGRAEDALGLPEGSYSTRYSSQTEAFTSLWTTNGAMTAEVPGLGGCSGRHPVLGDPETEDDYVTYGTSPVGIVDETGACR